MRSRAMRSLYGGHNLEATLESTNWKSCSIVVVALSCLCVLHLCPIILFHASYVNLDEQLTYIIHV
jgi:hypothetical protein